MNGNREEEAARPSDLGHTRHGSDLDEKGSAIVEASAS